MSQNDLNLSDQGGPSFRSDVNSALQALASLSAGNSAPTTTYPNMLWADTTNSVLKRRNNADSAWIIVGSLDASKVISKTANYTATLSDHGKTILVDATSGDITITLLAASTATNGFKLNVIKIDSSYNSVIIDGDSSETIAGSTTKTIKKQYGFYGIVCDASNWHVESSDTLLANNTYLSALNAAGDGIVNMIKVDDSDTVVVPDGIQTATNAAPSNDKDLVNKKYVDDSIGIGVVNFSYASTSTFISSSSTIPADDTLPQNTEGVEVVTVAHTPTESGVTLVVEGIVHVAEAANTANNAIVALFLNSDADAVSVSCEESPAALSVHSIKIKYKMIASSTTEITFKLRAGLDGGTVNINGASGSRKFGGALISSISVTEIKI